MTKMKRMTNKVNEYIYGYKALALATVFVVVVSSLAAGCGGKKVDEDIAAKLAREWTAKNTVYVTDQIHSALSDNTDMDSDTLQSVIEEEMDEGIEWTYSDPEKISDSAYNVIAKTTFEYDVPEVGEASVEIGIELTCYADKAVVADITFDSWRQDSLDSLVNEELEFE